MLMVKDVNAPPLPYANNTNRTLKCQFDPKFNILCEHIGEILTVLLKK